MVLFKIENILLNDFISFIHLEVSKNAVAKSADAYRPILNEQNRFLITILSRIQKY